MRKTNRDFLTLFLVVLVILSDSDDAKREEEYVMQFENPPIVNSKP